MVVLPQEVVLWGGEDKFSKSVRVLSQRWLFDGVGVVRPEAVGFIPYEALIHSTGSRV